MAWKFKITEALPWERNKAEYNAMFDAMFALGRLSPECKVLDVGGWSASFDTEWTKNGAK